MSCRGHRLSSNWCLMGIQISALCKSGWTQGGKSLEWLNLEKKPQPMWEWNPELPLLRQTPYHLANKALSLLSLTYMHKNICVQSLIMCKRFLIHLTPQPGKWWIIVLCQSLEFVAEMRILAEMKIENHGKKYIFRGKKSASILSFLWKLRWWTCECKLEVSNWYLSWILVCKISSNLPPECLKLHRF